MSSDRLQLNLRLDKQPELYEAVKAKAKEQGESLNDFALNALRQAIGWELEKSPISEAINRIVALEKRMKSVEEQLVQTIILTEHSVEPSKPLNQTKLCLCFGINNKSLARQAREAHQNIQEYLQEKTGWQYNKGDDKYYPPSDSTNGKNRNG
jgi:hypothetical protein